MRVFLVLAPCVLAAAVFNSSSEHHDACGSRRGVIDLGANDGRGLAVLKQLPPAAATVVVAFEFNAGFGPVLRNMLARLPNGELQQAAAWTHGQGVDVELQMPGRPSAPRRSDSIERPDNATGSSVVVGGEALNRRSKCAAAAWCSAGSRREHVPSLDLAAWLKRRFCVADLLVVKLDIEGGEWELLDHLTRSGAAQLIDHLAVEWHLGQRARRLSKERTRLKAWQSQIEARLAQAGVRMLRAWEDEPLRAALQPAATPTATADAIAASASARVDGSGGALRTAVGLCKGAKKFRKLCCRKLGPNAEGCRPGPKN
jgi:FkbM family methyltransferase